MNPSTQPEPARRPRFPVLLCILGSFALAAFAPNVAPIAAALLVVYGLVLWRDRARRADAVLLLVTGVMLTVLILYVLLFLQVGGYTVEESKPGLAPVTPRPRTIIPATAPTTPAAQ